MGSPRALNRGVGASYATRIDTTTPDSRSLLRAFASVPLDTDGARAFLQQRIGFFSRVLLVVIGGFQVLGRVMDLRSPGIVEHAIGPHVLTYQGIGLVGFALVWWRSVRGRCGSTELHALDLLLTLAPPWAACATVFRISPELRPELLLEIMIAHLLMVRAVIVPSTPRRTLLCGIAVGAPMLATTYDYYGSHTTSAAPVLMYLVSTGAWVIASIGISTLISYTIFGLRKRVVAAAQLGQYTLERRIGSGGMGVVYRARHALLRRPTAIKLLSPERAGEKELARFEREVQLTSQLTHPNTISIYDYGRTPEGVFYYAMEYLDGLDLQRLVELCGPQEPACVLRIVEQVSAALAEAHARDLIHRDIKPANVILCERGGVAGVAKVVDFGLVKSVHRDGDASLSSTQTITGTPLYLSPEAILAPDRVDARSDLYALGALAYFALTGTPVFEDASIVAVCAHHLHTHPEPPSKRLGRELPAELERLVLQLLDKDPARRPQSAAELAERWGALGVTFWTREQIATWWGDALRRREDGEGSRQGSSVGTSQTLAVDFRRRGSR